MPVFIRPYDLHELEFVSNAAVKPKCSAKKFLVKFRSNVNQLGAYPTKQFIRSFFMLKSAAFFNQGANLINDITSNIMIEAKDDYFGMVEV